MEEISYKAKVQLSESYPIIVVHDITKLKPWIVERWNDFDGYEYATGYFSVKENALKVADRLLAEYKTTHPKVKNCCWIYGENYEKLEQGLEDKIEKELELESR